MSTFIIREGFRSIQMFPRQTNNTDTFGAGAVLSAMFKPNLGQLQRMEDYEAAKCDWIS
jgi:hypothetical protein